MSLFSLKKKTQSSDNNEKTLESLEEITDENTEAVNDEIDTADTEDIDDEDEEYIDLDDDTVKSMDEQIKYGEGPKSDAKETVDYVDEVINFFTITDPIKLNLLERGKLDKETFIQQDVIKFIKTLTKDKDKQEEILKGFSSFVWSYDILDDLIAERDISDIKVYDWNRIRLKRLGKRETSTIRFRNEKHYIKFIEHVALKNKINISDTNAAQNFVDKESSEDAILRFNITTGFINSSGKPVLHIRKIPKIKLTESELIEYGMFDKKTANYLKKRVAESGGILFAGKGGSGKTTLMNFLLDYIPHDYSALVIQENEELFSNHPDMAFQHTVQNRGEGKIEYTLYDLARNGLLTDIDYFIIGEIKGSEAIYLLNAVYTGARGWASVHGASATEAMKKLVDYIKYNSDYSQEEALQMLLHLDTVVFMKDFKVAEIAEVTGYNAETGNLEYKKVL